MPRTTNVREKIAGLRAFHARHRRAPSYTEMLSVFRYRSKNAVFGLLRKLERGGYVTKTRGKIALTGKLTGSIRLLGAVPAGFPSPAEEELLDTFSLDEFLVARPEATYMLRVSGDSMIDAGIHPGDMILVERGVEPRPNDIVIAEVDGEWTLKYYRKDRAGVRLDPANARYPTIRPKDSLRVGGVVRSVIRKYG